MDNEFIPRYSTCSETGLRVCEIVEHLLVREDGKFQNVNPHPKARTSNTWLQGSLSTQGYPTVKVGKVKRTVHRLIAEAFISNYSSTLHVDHINGVRTDNRLCNLRMVTQHQNNLNLTYHREGKLPYLAYCPRKRRWLLRWKCNGKRKSLSFLTEELARAAYFQHISAT